ncbi:MAG: HDOD domain-containing protein [Rhodocyclaceae bacterium]|nr:HDOD domain-containing protein [Rhodocyclaceae bacterium]
MDTQSEILHRIFIGRHPILDRRQTTVGYELLFHPGPQEDADGDMPKRAAADVVCKAFAELGLSSALASQRVFINVDADFLLDDAVELLPQQQVVLELDSDETFAPPLLQRCRELKTRGYAFCLHWSGGACEGCGALLDMLGYAKVDVGEAMPEAYKALAARLRSNGGWMIAARVETLEAMQQCDRLGFDLFQGSYFAKPVLIAGRKLDPSTQGLIRIIGLLGEEDADFARIEAAFKGEPALLANLLRLTNSVGVGGRLSSRITSIRNAIAVVGQRQLLRWLQLLLFYRPGTSASRNPLLQLAALRGRLMELIAEAIHPTRRDLQDLAFITGLMSLMPAALGLSMTDILGQIAVAPDARRALSRREGELGLLLELIERYDDNDVAGTTALLDRVDVPLALNDLGGLLAKAIAWVQQLSAGGE